jgi:hypothetical protein
MREDSAGWDQDQAPAIRENAKVPHTFGDGLGLSKAQARSGSRHESRNDERKAPGVVARDALVLVPIERAFRDGGFPFPRENALFCAAVAIDTCLPGERLGAHTKHAATDKAVDHPPIIR